MRTQKTILLICCLWSVICCYAQQIPLKGRISIHNSKYNSGEIQYVENAQITAPFTTPTTSDSQGRFDLSFVRVQIGHSVDISVNKAGLEVVNKYDLQRVILGREPSLRVYLAEIGLLAQAQTELYQISEKALFARKNALIARLQSDAAESKAALAELEKSFGQKIGSVIEAIELLESKMQSLEKRLPDFAQELAAENLDFAATLYIRAYEAFKSGEIELAIQILDNATLEASYQEALKTIEKGKILESTGKDIQEQGLLQIDTIISSYGLKVKLLLFQFQYSEAIEIYKKVISIIEHIPQASESLSLAYGNLALVYFYNHQFKEAIEAGEKAIVAQKKEEHLDYLLLALLHDNLAVFYRSSKNFEKALQFHQLADELLKKGKKEDKNIAASLLNNRGNTYYSMDKFKEALNCHTKAISLFQELELPDVPRRMANTYNSIGLVYDALGNNKQAESNYDSALVFWEMIRNPVHPELASIYNNKGVIGLKNKTYKNSINLFLKAIDIQSQVLPPNHPHCYSPTFNLAFAYRSLGDYPKANEYYQKALKIKQNLFEAEDQELATLFNHIGVNYYYQEEYHKALESYERALSIQQSLSPVDSLDLAETYTNLGQIYGEQDSLTKGLNYLHKAKGIRKRYLGQNAPALGNSYDILAGVYYKNKNYPEAKQFFQKALNIWEKTLPPQDTKLATSTYNLGLTQFFLGVDRIAIELLEKVLSISKATNNAGGRDMAELYTWLGNACLRSMKYPKAKNYYKRAIEMDSSLSIVLSNNLGNALLKLNAFEEAEENFKRYEKTGNRPIIHRNWALYYTAIGEIDKAFDHLQKAIDFGYDNQDFLNNDPTLKPLRPDPRFKKLMEPLQNKK